MRLGAIDQVERQAGDRGGLMVRLHHPGAGAVQDLTGNRIARADDLHEAQALRDDAQQAPVMRVGTEIELVREGRDRQGRIEVAHAEIEHGLVGRRRNREMRAATLEKPMFEIEMRAAGFGSQVPIGRLVAAGSGIGGRRCVAHLILRRMTSGEKITWPDHATLHAFIAWRGKLRQVSRRHHAARSASRAKSARTAWAAAPSGRPGRALAFQA